MAAYTFDGSEQTIYSVGEVVTQPALLWVGRTVATGTQFSEIFHPYPSDPLTGASPWTPEAFASRLSMLADWWDANAAVPGVEEMAPSSNVSDLGQVWYVQIVVVSSTSGRSRVQLTVYPINFGPDRFAPLIAAQRAALDAIETSEGG